MAERLLEMIDQISDCKRILPSLARMARSENPHVRSKAVLMIGRSGPSLEWIENWTEKRLQESDARVRANAIEAMWGIDTDAAREALQWAARDSNNRVAGNALVGMYRLGEISPLADLIKMAARDSPPFRRTAAWVMGETGDPRFSEVLGRMIADTNAHVRKSAFRAVGRIREAKARALQTVEWPLAVAANAKDPRTGERCVSVSVVTADGRGNPRILPAQFVLTESGHAVWSYRVAEKTPPGPMTILFLFPRKPDSSGRLWDQSASRGLKCKRSTDVWSAAPYSGVEDTPDKRPADAESPSFNANTAQAAGTLQDTPKRADCTGFWAAVQSALLAGNSKVRGERHVIVLVSEEVSESADENLAATVQSTRTSIEVVSTCANPALREFCRRAGGRFHYVGQNSTLEDAVSLAYLSLLARYEIFYQSVASDPAKLKVRVHTSAGWGETTVSL